MKPANLFFIELIIALLFFALSAVAILQVFSAADTRQRTSTLTERSVICAQSIAEAFSVSGNIGFALSEVFGEGVQLDCEALMLDDEMRPSADGIVMLTTDVQQESSAAGTLKRLSICFSSNGEQLFALSCAAYIPDNGGAADE